MTSVGQGIWWWGVAYGQSMRDRSNIRLLALKYTVYKCGKMLRYLMKTCTGLDVQAKIQRAKLTKKIEDTMVELFDNSDQ